jgi:DNA-binding LacI/PurR family transcriptional regulator/transposase-like protein
MPEVCCPRCGSSAGQVRAGTNGGRQQYQCGACRRRYVPEPKRRGYPDSLRDRAAALHAEDWTLVRIGETLGVTPRTLRNWFQERTANGAAQADPAGDPPEAVADRPSDRVAPEAPPGRRKRVTIHDVAERAGVAPSTVSNYMNDKGRMNAGTRERVRKAIDVLHFTPNAMTRAIRNRQTRILGVVAFGIWDFAYSPDYSIIPPLLAGINQAAEGAGNDVLLYTSWSTPGSHGGVRFLDGHIDGLLVIGSTLPKSVLQRTAAAGLPVVTPLTRHVPANVGYVDIDNIAAMHFVVEHLVSLGRRRIGYVGPLHDSDHIDRYQGFGEAMIAAGLDWDPSPTEPAYRSPWGSDLVEARLRRVIEIAMTLDAIVVPNDWLAVQVVEELGKHGIRVPEDIAVTGFDDVPEAAHIAGGLTTIRQPFRRIGQLAVERLLAMIEGAPVSECRLTLPAELIVRASTAGR